MNYTQNIKIAQVAEKTLVMGVDIGSETNYARAFNWRGQELPKKDIISQQLGRLPGLLGASRSLMQIFLYVNLRIRSLSMRLAICRRKMLHGATPAIKRHSKWASAPCFTFGTSRIWHKNRLYFNIFRTK